MCTPWYTCVHLGTHVHTLAHMCTPWHTCVHLGTHVYTAAHMCTFCFIFPFSQMLMQYIYTYNIRQGFSIIYTPRTSSIKPMSSLMISGLLLKKFSMISFVLTNVCGLCWFLLFAFCMLCRIFSVVRLS